VEWRSRCQISRGYLDRIDHITAQELELNLQDAIKRFTECPRFRDDGTG